MRRRALGRACIGSLSGACLPGIAANIRQGRAQRFATFYA